MPNKKLLRDISAVWLVIIAIYAITRHWQLKYNGSTSLPQTLWIAHIGDKNLHYNDYVIFKFHDYRMQNHDDYELIVKQVSGIGGDEIIANYESEFNNWVYKLPSGRTFLTYETISGWHFNPLTSHNMKIPKGCYFVNGLHQPTFDSRYKEFGLVCESQIIAKGYPDL